MQDLSLHILDIVENSLTAGAKLVEIRIEEELRQNRLSIEIKDDGKGMDEGVQERALDPFFSTKTCRRVGLGLPLFQESCQQCKGEFLLESHPGQGTKIRAIFPHNHLDRKPLGNLAETLITLIVGHPDVDIFYEHKRDGIKFALDTREIKALLEGVPLNDAEVITFLRSYISSEMAELGLDREYII